MHRGFDRTRTDPAAETVAADSRAAGSRRTAAAASSVCPFCGTVSEGPPGGPCRQCGMENTQATRTATRSKIGPWFVWQSRNPSAPGMNWATLTALIERGRITPRTIMRGPTTGQLWRFASRVKGVSREFGLCWHCGASIEKVARLCQACKRLQQPPVNPDVLLETDLPSSAPPQPAPRASGPAPETTEDVAIPSPAAGGEDEPLEHVPPPPRRSAPAEAPRSAAKAPPAPADLLDGRVPIVDAGQQQGVVSNLEMRAFSLPGDYTAGPEDDYSAPRRGGGGVGRKVAWAAVVAILSGVAAGGYSPPFREMVLRGYRNVVAKLSGRPAETPAAAAPQPRPLAPVPAAVRPQRESIPAALREAAVPSPTAPTTQAASQTPLMAIDPSALRRTPVADAAAPRAAAPTSTKARAATSKPIAAPPPAPQVSVGPGSSAHETAKPPRPTSPPQVVTNPPVQTQPSPATGGAQVQISAPPPVDPQLAERWAWERYERAFKAEQKQDYAQAAKDYEWIRDLRLPDGVGPSDVQSRLDRVKQLLQQRQQQQGGTH